MIFTYTFTGIFVVLNWVLSYLPAMDSGILDKFTDFMNYLVPKFVALGYYYLPMDDILWYIQTYVTVWISVFGIKLLLRLVPILSGGTIKTDKL